MTAKEGQWAGGGRRAEGESQPARNPEAGVASGSEGISGFKLSPTLCHVILLSSLSKL